MVAARQVTFPALSRKANLHVKDSTKALDPLCKQIFLYEFCIDVELRTTIEKGVL